MASGSGETSRFGGGCCVRLWEGLGGFPSAKFLLMLHGMVVAYGMCIFSGMMSIEPHMWRKRHYWKRNGTPIF